MNKFLSEILSQLYFGHVPGWESHAHSTAEQRAVNEKIDTEMKYFSGLMSASEDDCKRLDAFDDLYKQSCSIENMHSFKFAFRLGVLLMCAVFMGEDGAEQ